MLLNNLNANIESEKLPGKYLIENKLIDLGFQILIDSCCVPINKSFESDYDFFIVRNTNKFVIFKNC